MARCALHAVPQPGLCKFCAADQVVRRRRNRTLGVGAALLSVIAAITIVLLRLPKPPPPPAKPVREADDLVRMQRERLAATPCDPKTSLHLVERLEELTRWDDARLAAEASIRDCGVIGKMKWRLIHADQQLGRWPDVIKLTGDLIADHPDDSDFWWWRGEGFEGAGQPRAALADYRQSLALSERAQAGQFAANRFLAAARKAGALCEAQRAWRYYVRLGGRPSQEMRDEDAALLRARTCAPAHGAGRAVLTDRVRVTLDGATDAFRIDLELGTTLVSRMFAARAGLIPPGTEHADAYTAGRLVHGEPMQVTLRVGGATARNVDVLITDDLPGDAAGVLGLSLLWRFAYYDDGSRIVLEPPIDEAL